MIFEFLIKPRQAVVFILPHIEWARGCRVAFMDGDETPTPTRSVRRIMSIMAMPWEQLDDEESTHRSFAKMWLIEFPENGLWLSFANFCSARAWAAECLQGKICHKSILINIFGAENFQQASRIIRRIKFLTKHELQISLWLARFIVEAECLKDDKKLRRGFWNCFAITICMSGGGEAKVAKERTYDTRCNHNKKLCNFSSTCLLKSSKVQFVLVSWERKNFFFPFSFMISNDKAFYAIF